MQAKYVNVLWAVFIMLVSVAVLFARTAIAELTTLKILTEGDNYSWLRYLPGRMKADIHSDLDKINAVLQQIVHILHWLGLGSFALSTLWLLLFFVVWLRKT